MAPRANWKGYLKLSLVSCPIALYPAASGSERVSFNRINKKTGHRLKQQLVDGETGEPVDKDDIGRGYEIGKGQYLQVEDDEIDKIRIESTHIVDSKATHFDPAMFEDHYENALVELLRAKQAGRMVEAPREEPAPQRVINLMDALRASIGAETKKKPAAASTKVRAKAPAGKR